MLTDGWIRPDRAQGFDQPIRGLTLSYIYQNVALVKLFQLIVTANYVSYGNAVKNLIVFCEKFKIDEAG